MHGINFCSFIIISHFLILNVLSFQLQLDKEAQDITNSQRIEIINSAFGEICASTFEYVKIGEGFTTQVENITFNMWYSVNETNRLLIAPIYTLCIQVRNRNEHGQYVNASIAAKMTARSWIYAQKWINREFKYNPTDYTALQAKRDFIRKFEERLAEEFGGRPTVTNSVCSGKIPSNEPNYSIFCWN